MTGKGLHYAEWFAAVTSNTGHRWQQQLGDHPACVDRLIRIPTGFGKTAGTVLPWLFHRVKQKNLDWPTRLVFCLPMRTLVEQSERGIRGWIDKAGLAGDVSLHVLMGGVEAARWRIVPEVPRILVGTQDMLMSRALNRGYASGRAAWPMEFGLLHHDCLWIFDEIQLQDVGLATSAQLAAFRTQDEKSKTSVLRPTRTWWMSATLQPSWLETVDFAPRVARLSAEATSIPPAERRGGLWRVKKPLSHVAETTLAPPEIVAALVRELHEPGKLSLCVVNTVGRAAKVFEALQEAVEGPKKKGKGAGKAATSQPELELVHSRFRGAERRRWTDESAGFLSRSAKLPEGGRIIVATQVVEAGVDLSAQVLVTDLAPWPSLVQRFGRCARYEGEQGRLVVVGGPPEDEKKCLPYAPEALLAAAEALDRLIEAEKDGAPDALERFESGLSGAERARLYPYEPKFVLRRRDLDALFDTAADLDGADLDIGRFIRSTEERDAQVFWREGFDPEKPETHPKPSEILRDELCTVPLGKEQLEKLLEKRSGYVFDYVDGAWQRVDRYRLYAGMQILLRSEEGGYLPRGGLAPDSTARVAPVSVHAPPTRDLLDQASRADGDDALSEADWKSIALHGRETAQVMDRLGKALGLPEPLLSALLLAARWHDAGKAHEHFQRAILEDARTNEGGGALGRDLAKAPSGAWKRPQYPARPGLRHELASMLALLELLRRVKPDHPALLGPHLELLAAIGSAPVAVADADRVPVTDPLAAELAALDGPTFDLVAYLVCAHHGKVRCSLTSTPHDQESPEGRIHGVQEGDVLPSFALAGPGGSEVALPALTLSLAPAELGVGERYGASWSERVAALVALHGPFQLAFLEALLRSADAIASGARTPPAAPVTAP